MPGVSDGNLFQNAVYVGIHLQDILYGVELVLYFRTMYSLLTHEGARKKSDVFYASFSTVMLLMFTIWVSTQAIFGEKMWLLDAGFPGGPTAYWPANISVWYMDWGAIAITVLQLMTAALMIYRCRIIWNSYCAIIVPLILWIATLVLVIWTSSTRGTGFFCGVASRFGLAYYTVSVFLAVMLTCMICYRLMWYGRMVKKHLGSEHASPYFAIAALVVETVLPCTLSGIAFLISFGVGNQISVGFACVFISLMCISPQMVILRMALGRAWTKDTCRQALSTISFSPREDVTSESELQSSGEVVVHLRTFESTQTGDDKV